MRRYWLGISGNVLEHYNQALYGFLTPVLAPLFFPFLDPIYALLCAYALFPLTFLSKPLGAIIFGRLGDRIGRQKVLSITLLGMGGATASMACLPLYEQAGWLAPFLLTLGRLIQNFFAAGECTGGALFVVEEIEEKRRGWISSLFDASSIFGILLASIAATFFSASWRWLYLAGTATAFTGFLFRRNALQKTPPHQQIEMGELWRHWRPMLAIASIVGYSYANYYLLTNFLNGFLPIVSLITAKQALGMNTTLLFLDFLLLPFFGYLTLRIEKEKLMLTALITGLVVSLPLFMLLDGADAWLAAGVRLALTIIGVAFSAPYHAWAIEQCPKELRFSICAMGAAIGSRLIGAPMPVISLWLYQQTKWTGIAALPTIFTGLFALSVLLRSRYALVMQRSAN